MPSQHRSWLILKHAYLRAAELQTLLDLYGSADDIVSQPRSRLLESGLSAEKCDAIATANDTAIRAALECNPTHGGQRNAHDFSRHLASQGFVIVSGLAQGIDTAAHEGALDAGGKTIAFLGTGIDRVYPAANRGLAHAIAEEGALVSEYPLGAPPERWHFPERNRLISGLSLGTLVVEAARRSGSLITARLAAEQGREVFALPGSIHNALSRGCHELIRQGAKLVESASDILGELRPLAGHMQETADESATNEPEPAEADDDYIELRKVLSHDPASIDELEKKSGLTIDQLSSMLLILELHGEVESLSGGRYVLTG
jgi:DNA processing protein